MAADELMDQVLMPGLPRDLAVRIIAFVPFCHYHDKLAYVSHSWENAIHSGELFRRRQEVNAAEELVCVHTNKWVVYDPRNKGWSSLPLIPQTIHGRSYFGVAFIAQKLFVIGGGSCVVNPLSGDEDGLCPWHQNGEDKRLSCCSNEVWSYDPVSRVWTERAPMAVPRTMFACCVWNGKVLVAGGLTNCRSPTSTAELYDPLTDSWSPIPDLQQTTKSECSGMVLEGRVHVFYDGMENLQTLEGVDRRWIVHQGSSLAQTSPRANQRTMVKEELYTLDREGHLRTKDGDVIAYLPEYRRQLPAEEEPYISGFGLIGSDDRIYIIGGVKFFPNVHRELTDVVSVGIEDGLVNWRLTQLPLRTRCVGGRVHGCTLMKI